MWMLMWQQAVVVPGWVGPTVAISLAIVAAAFVVIAVAVLGLARTVGAEARKLDASTAGLREDAAKAIASVRTMSEQASETLALVRDEAGAFVHTSRRIRRKLLRGVDRVEERLVDLDTLYGVVHDEVEEAALDVASTLRAVRSGRGAIGMLRRLLVSRR